jgi:hypothetical protein
MSFSDVRPIAKRCATHSRRPGLAPGPTIPDIVVTEGIYDPAETRRHGVAMSAIALTLGYRRKAGTTSMDFRDSIFKHPPLANAASRSRRASHASFRLKTFRPLEGGACGPQERVQGMPGAGGARSPCAKCSKHTVVTAVTPESPAFPAQWF